MKGAVLLFCAIGLAAATTDFFKPADKQFLKRQYDLLSLFVNVHEFSYVDQEITFSNTFDFQKYYEFSTNQFAVKQFQEAYEFGVLPRGEVFNYFNPTHLKQAIQLFDFFFFAKDYDSFYQAACWARNHVNEIMFVYSFSVAVLNRPDTQGFVIPPMSEVLPYMYIHTRAFQEATVFKQQGFQQATVVSNNTNKYAYNLLSIMNNYQASKEFPYTTDFLGQLYEKYDSAENRMSYFREDIYLNQQFAFEQLKNPSWFSYEKYQIKREVITQNNGENFYYFLQQMLARYNMERYANDLPFVRPFEFDQKTIEFGYNPMIQYYNGEVMPFRPDNYRTSFANNKDLYQFKKIDSRFVDAVDSMQVFDFNGTKVPFTYENGIKVLGNLFQNNGYSVNNQFYSTAQGFYGYLDQCRRVVASMVDANNQHYTAPGVVETDHSAFRDPVFYQCICRLVNHIQTYKNQMRPYTEEELVFQGVKVKTFTTEKLITFFDYAEVDMFNAISYKQGETAERFSYKAQQLQLNYKPFTYQIQVDSDKNADVIVRVFFGPKYDVMGRVLTLEQARQYFVEFDRFNYTVKSGQNTIQRNSQESTRFTEVLRNTRDIFSTLKKAQQGGETYYYNQYFSQMWATFPQNILLPRGSRAGQEYVFVAAVYPYQQTQYDPLFQVMPLDSKPQGFPFDRVVRYDTFQQAQNIHFQTVKIFHKTQEEFNNLHL